MIKTRVSVAALVVLGASLGTACAQDRFEANSQGYIGGYNTFGGFYDTFGGYGGQHSYGYRRFNQGYSSTATVLAVPFVGASDTPDPCKWLRKKAFETHSAKWRARYVACFKGQ